MKIKILILYFLLLVNNIIAQTVSSKDSIITFANKSYVKVELKTYNTFTFKEYEWSYFSDIDFKIFIFVLIILIVARFIIKKQYEK